MPTGQLLTCRLLQHKHGETFTINPGDVLLAEDHIGSGHKWRRTKLDFGFVGDTKSTLRALLPKLAQNPNQAHLNESVTHYRKARKGLDELAIGNSGKKNIHPQFLARVLDEVAAENAVFSCDVGTPTIWAARYVRMNGKRRILGSFTHGSMANALPQAIGGAGQLPRPASDLDVWRWRSLDAHGGSAHATATNCR